MPTPPFRLDLTRHLDPVLQLARARPDRVQLLAWAIRYLAQNTGGLDVINVGRPGTLRPVEVLGAAWLDAVRRALGREGFGDVEAVVEPVSELVGAGARPARVLWSTGTAARRGRHPDGDGQSWAGRLQARPDPRVTLNFDRRCRRCGD